MKLVAALVLALTLGACTQVQTAVQTAQAKETGVITDILQFTDADLKAAIKLADAAVPPDVEVHNCFTYLDNLVLAAQGHVSSPAPTTVGAAVLFEQLNLGLNTADALLSKSSKVDLELACAPLEAHVRHRLLSLAASTTSILGAIGIKVVIPLAP